jgi:quinoprotein glucose dehydrogenase
MRTIAVALFLIIFATNDNDWPNVGNDKGAGRYSTLSQINRTNVAKLKVAWSFSAGGASFDARSAIQCTPIVIDGVMYVTGPDLNVIALDAATGRELWRFDVQRSKSNSYLHNRGVAFWSEDPQRSTAAKRILAATPDGFLYSLDAQTGKPDSHFGSSGRVDLREGVDGDLRGFVYGVTSAPVVFEDLVILGFSLDEGYRGAPGDVRAFDVRTGKERWRFQTIPRNGELGYDSWKGDSWKNRPGVNAWAGATLDTKRGMIFVGLGSPGFDFYGGDRAGNNLFANCVLALDARSGRRLWHYQIVHHDLWDYDLPYPPILVTLRRDGVAVDAVAQITKQGFAFVFERVTGRPFFEIVERSVPRSDAPGEQSAPTQPAPVRPPPFTPQGFSDNDITDISPEARDAVRAKLAGARRGPVYTPPSVEGTILNPGTIGGGNWSGASFDPTKGLLYVNANNFPRVVRLLPTHNKDGPFRDAGQVRLIDHEGYPGMKPPWGTLTAIDLNRGEIRWQETLGEFAQLTARGVRKTGTPNLGGSIVTAGGLVFIGGTMDEMFRAFDSDSGRVLWEHKLPFGGYAAPCTYSVNGRQFVAIAAGGGGKLGTRSGDAFVAFALP